ncbi:hypothetical protein C1X75_17840 [Pseudomonas sp. FW305-17]|nr:hypothetical protein C1X79_22455 [Pseudomonas sp. FW305-42]PNA20864.1 hypothetical protein C1X78_20770 [Pseudomonas sp. MPR-R1B]PNB20815.1 hypothetical protein C1X80_22815 [Pseudomonas sp. DP16D-E2]PNB41997.1 hypothetical protein C1X75_17840 [Pseudomonas sp. FW305-17]PNB63437.1 hypothetical protein C1X77_07470 [Pseudomonas sp. GW531-E2]PNB65456.1 hypothetical protein C1X76_23440 [Pseudomonas sp. FW305-127]
MNPASWLQVVLNLYGTAVATSAKTAQAMTIFQWKSGPELLSSGDNMYCLATLEIDRGQAAEISCMVLVRYAWHTRAILNV